MTQDVNILHHIGLISHDLNAMASRFESLGFTLTPSSLPRIPLRVGEEPQPIGVANRCAIFKDNYLEFLGVVDPRQWARVTAEQRGPYDIDRPLRRYEGLHVLHYGADDLDVVSHRLKANGIEHQPIRPFQRLVNTPAGMQMMRARTLSLPEGQMPESLFQVAQHETPELVLQPRYMHHANGATAIADIILCVEDCAEVSARYAAVAGKGVQIEGRIHRIRLGRSDILVTDPTGLREILPGEAPPTLPYLAGFTVSADIHQSADFLERACVPVKYVDGYVLVPGQHACGAAIRFLDEAAE